MKPVRILIVDGHPFFVKGLRICLEGLCGLEVAGAASDGKEAQECRKHLQPDLVLMNACLSGVLSGFETCRLMKERDTNVKVVLYTDSEPTLSSVLKRCGADACLPQEDLFEKLAAVIGELFVTNKPRIVR